jgi:3-dehydroquinate synthase
MTTLKPLHIKSGQGIYNVEFIRTIESVDERFFLNNDCRIIIDRRVYNLYSEALSPLLQRFPAYIIDATEREKTIDGVTRVWDFLQSTNSIKSTEIIAIGGGIIQDLVQFASHNYYRGIRWHHLPTTLLSQADSCIGAKCGINHGAYKNQLGAFHSPTSVLISSEFLQTLDITDIQSGYGEILKLYLTGSDPEDFADLENKFYDSEMSQLVDENIIRRSLEIKQEIIEQDEYELDLRRVLNYGHTFGHALETITRNLVPHGIAVAWGIDLVNYIALCRCKITPDHFHRIHKFILTHFKTNIFCSISAETLIAATRRDKKVEGNLVNLILPTGIGTLCIEPVEFDAKLVKNVCDYLDRHNALFSN